MSVSTASNRANPSTSAHAIVSVPDASLTEIDGNTPLQKKNNKTEFVKPKINNY